MEYTITDNASSNAMSPNIFKWEYFDLLLVASPGKLIVWEEDLLATHQDSRLPVPRLPEHHMHYGLLKWQPTKILATAANKKLSIAYQGCQMSSAANFFIIF